MSAIPDLAPRSLLRAPDFLKLWSGQSISAFGTQVTILAVPILAAAALQVSPLEFGLLAPSNSCRSSSSACPPASGSTGCGAGRSSSPGTSAAPCVSCRSLAFALDVLTIWQLYAVVFVNGCLTVFFDVAYQSYLPSIVERDQLVDGNAKLELTRASSQRLGPGLAGLLIGALTAPVAILVDAVSYVVSALFVLAIRRGEPTSAPHDDAAGRRPSVRREMVEGLRSVGRQPVLRALALSIAVSYLFSTIADSILILFLVTERAFGPQLIGIRAIPESVEGAAT